MEHYYIGIDMGTSAVKLIAIDEAGRLAAEGREEYEVDKPQEGWKEIEPEVWFQAARGGLIKLLCQLDRDKVRGISFAGQMHTTIFLNEKGASIRPAIMWNDCRSKHLARELKRKAGGRPQLRYISQILSQGSPAANLLWLREYEPDHFTVLKKFLIGPDYLVYRFSGRYGTDYCEASTSSLYDLEQRRWSEEMRRLIGIPKECYPEVRGSAQAAGRLLPELAEELGLSDRVEIVTGTGDNPAAAVCAGCLSGRYPVLSIGTSGVLVIPRERLDLSSGFKNVLFSLDSRQIWVLVQGVVQSAGSSLRWWMRDILQVEDYARGDTTIDLEESFCPSLFFYPHLVGEKVIHADPDVRGAFLGIGTDTSRANLTLAVMEGVCFGLRELFEKLGDPLEGMRSIQVIGGGARSPVWMQVLSDILQMEVEQMDNSMGAAYGAALIADFACEGIDSLSELTGNLQPEKKSFLPRPIFVERYQAKYQIYKKIYRALISLRE